MRIVAGDVGGTKVLLQLVDDGKVVAEHRFDSAAFATFDELFHQFVTLAGTPIDAACFAVAGPVLDGRAEVTNLKWEMEEKALAVAFGIPRLALINDFYAVAMGVPLLQPTDLISLNAGQRQHGAPIGILGAGTGLGEAIVTFAGEQWTVVASEGGHADFGPQDEEQCALFTHLFKRYGHVSWERVLSGMGITNIHEFLGGTETDPARITDLASRGDVIAQRTMAMFVDIYGAEAGNMALRVLARGGLFLAGGIAGKNVERFTDGHFLTAFLRKGRFRDLLAGMPVDLIANEKVGLLGAAEMAKRLLHEHA